MKLFQKKLKHLEIIINKTMDDLKTIRHEIQLICLYIIETEEEDYNNSLEKEQHVFAKAKKILESI